MILIVIKPDKIKDRIVFVIWMAVKRWCQNAKIQQNGILYVSFKWFLTIDL